MNAKERHHYRVYLADKKSKFESGLLGGVYRVSRGEPMRHGGGEIYYLGSKNTRLEYSFKKNLLTAGRSHDRMQKVNST